MQVLLPTCQQAASGVSLLVCLCCGVCVCPSNNRVCVCVCHFADPITRSVFVVAVVWVRVVHLLMLCFVVVF